MGRRVFALPFLIGVFLLVAAGPALATVSGTITCNGSAVITEKGSTKTYTIRATDATATIPRAGVAAWQGSVSPVTHNHSGAVSVGLGPKSITVGSWGPSKNEGGAQTKAGIKTYNVPSWVPPFEIEVKGFHKGDEGRCDGTIKVDLVGSVFGSAAGFVIAAGTVLTGVFTFVSGIAKKVG